MLRTEKGRYVFIINCVYAFFEGMVALKLFDWKLFDDTPGAYRIEWILYGYL